MEIKVIRQTGFDRVRVGVGGMKEGEGFHWQFGRLLTTILDG